MDLDDLFERREYRGSRGADWRGHGSHGGHHGHGSILANPAMQRLLRSRAAWTATAIVAVVGVALVLAVGWGLVGYVRAQGLRGLVEAAVSVGRAVWQGGGGGAP